MTSSEVAMPPPFKPKSNLNTCTYPFGPSA